MTVGAEETPAQSWGPAVGTLELAAAQLDALARDALRHLRGEELGLTRTLTLALALALALAHRRSAWPDPSPP